MALCDHCDNLSRRTNVTQSKSDKQTFIMNIIQRKVMHKYSFATVYTQTSITEGDTTVFGSAVLLPCASGEKANRMRKEQQE